MELTLKQKTAFGIGAVGKDMVYALSASYVMYYYQDVLGFRPALWDWCSWRPGSLMPSTTPLWGFWWQDPHPLGTFPSVDLFRHAAQCTGTLRPVCRPGAG